MRRAYADTPWGQIHYRFEGQGEALLLLHQTAWSSLMYEKALPIFGRYYRVIAMDTLGYGESDKPSRPMEIPDYAECVADFLDALGIDQANVVGHHTGGGIGVELAVLHPERVTKLVIYGAPYWEPEERDQMLKTGAPPVALKEDGSHLMYWWERAKKRNPTAGPELWQKTVLQNLKAGEYYNSAYNAIFQFDIGPRLPLLKRPTLVLCGDQDMLYKANKAVLALIPRAREVVIPEVGSLIIDQRTEEYTKAVSDFLANPGV